MPRAEVVQVDLHLVRMEVAVDTGTVQVSQAAAAMGVVHLMVLCVELMDQKEMEGVEMMDQEGEEVTMEEGERAENKEEEAEARPTSIPPIA